MKGRMEGRGERKSRMCAWELTAWKLSGFSGPPHKKQTASQERTAWYVKHRNKQINTHYPAHIHSGKELFPDEVNQPVIRSRLRLVVQVVSAATCVAYMASPFRHTLN